MNQRIIKLYEQAQDEVVDSDCADYYERIQLKFAELIVRKCATIAEQAEPYRANDLILKHFGVEE